MCFSYRVFFVFNSVLSSYEKIYFLLRKWPSHVCLIRSERIRWGGVEAPKPLLAEWCSTPPTPSNPGMAGTWVGRGRTLVGHGGARAGHGGPGRGLEGA